ncbi:hypothetical protein [Niabella aquatica]
MRTGVKLILIVIVWIIGAVVGVGLGDATGTKHGGGLGIAVMTGVIAATAAIWKWKPDNQKKG